MRLGYLDICACVCVRAHVHVAFACSNMCVEYFNAFLRVEGSELDGFRKNTEVLIVIKIQFNIV